MKRITAVFLCVIMAALVMCSCGNNKGREYYNMNLKKYVTLPEYKGLKVDTSSDEFKKVYDEIIDSDVSDNDFYVKKTEGTVAQGDTANIDYCGKLNGEAFDGGTAEGYDLEIGSGNFIEGFEDGLIGVSIGSTVDLNLTFPANYGSQDLAGKAVVFTVKVNYVRTNEPISPEDYYKKLDFDTLSAYKADVKKRAVKSYLVDKVVDKTKISSYPKEELDRIYLVYYNQADEYYTQNYGVSLEYMLSYQGQDPDEFREMILKNYVHPLMKNQMTLYYIADKEKIKVTKTLVNAKIDSEIKKLPEGVTRETLISRYGDYYFEYSVFYDKVADFLCDNAKIK